MSDIRSIIDPPTPENELTAQETEVHDEHDLAKKKIYDSFEKIKTHIPAARIKKIMQSDDDIGKVAQATPVVVGRALEIFMADLVEAATAEAKKSGVRRIGVAQIRSVIQKTEQFDFLVDALEKYAPNDR